MGRPTKLLRCATAGLLAFFLVPSHAQKAGLSQSICSTQNTADGESRECMCSGPYIIKLMAVFRIRHIPIQRIVL
jgi:hypothetical protein